jgi:hypothetical protein
MRSGNIPDWLPGQTVIHGQNQVLVPSEGGVGLDGIDQSTQLRGQAGLDAGLSPVDAKGPVPRSGSWALVLLKDGGFNSGLGNSVSVRALASANCKLGDVSRLLEHMAHQQARGTLCDARSVNIIGALR